MKKIRPRSLAAVKAFRRRVYSYYRRYGRQLPWRQTRISYAIFVSEVMLQQTQVTRVLKFYPKFLKKFPTVEKLARASLRQVLRQWQGLGYNRRAVALRRSAQIVVSRHQGKIPADPNLLQKLPGIGPATASAIAVYAFNRPAVFIETNIRSVFLHEFFPQRHKIADEEIVPIVEQTMDRRNPRRWYGALMDYGAHVKSLHGNPNRRSRHYGRQTSFAGSDRQMRGAIVKLLTQRRSITSAELQTAIPALKYRQRKVLKSLVQDGLLQSKGRHFFLA